MEIKKEELATYKQKVAFLDELWRNQILLVDFEIASDMNDALFSEDVEFSDEQFEKYCSVASDAYLKAEEMTTWAMCRTVADIIKENGEEALFKMSKYELIDKATYLL